MSGEESPTFVAFLTGVQGCLNVNRTAKEHAGGQKSLEMKKYILKNKMSSNVSHYSVTGGENWLNIN